jgi:23S rRNA U2552 (ribose-2'-O)-methylase RlmE/FtsJ
MSYYILPKINNNLIVNPKCYYNKCTVYCSFSLYNYYNSIKSQIDFICSNKSDLIYNYNELIKIVNPYEYVFFTVPGSKYSVSKLKPNSNNFYDLLEIFMTLNILDLYNNKSIKSLHFSLDNDDTVDCIEMLREKYNDDVIIKLNENDEEIYKTINDLKFDIMFFNKSHNDINSYIINFIKFVMNILRYQEFGGTTIIKIDYIFHKPIIDLLYLLSSLFEKVYIIKPNTSNITNFEKYIVCKNFNSSTEIKLELYKNNYSKLSNFIKKLDNKNITSIIDNDAQYYFINKIDDMNIILGHQQLESLSQIINILKNKNKEEKIENIKKNSIQKAVIWCEKFKIPCNRFSEKTNIFLPIVKEPKELTKVKDEYVILENTDFLRDI